MVDGKILNTLTMVDDKVLNTLTGSLSQIVNETLNVLILFVIFRPNAKISNKERQL